MRDWFACNVSFDVVLSKHKDSEDHAEGEHNAKSSTLEGEDKPESNIPHIRIFSTKSIESEPTVPYNQMKMSIGTQASECMIIEELSALPPMNGKRRAAESPLFSKSTYSFKSPREVRRNSRNHGRK